MKKRILLLALLLLTFARFAEFRDISSAPTLTDVPLKFLMVTGEGYMETLGYFDKRGTGTGYIHYRDWLTEDPNRWVKSSGWFDKDLDRTTKTFGDGSVHFYSTTGALKTWYVATYIGEPLGYLAKPGEKWFIFDLRMNDTSSVTSLELRCLSSYTHYFHITIANISSYASNQWFRIKSRMNDWTVGGGSPSWAEIYRWEWRFTASSPVAFEFWIDDFMLTSNYFYDLALKNLQHTFKAVTIETVNWDALPSSFDEYSAVIYPENRINNTGISLLDSYVHNGGGLIMMGLSTLWYANETEQFDFPLSCSPISITNTTETFLENAKDVDSFADHPALYPFTNYTLYVQRGYEYYRPKPFFKHLEVYNTSLAEGAEALMREGTFLLEAAKSYGSGKVVYFAENLVKRIANGMMKLTTVKYNNHLSQGWEGSTANRLQVLKSAVQWVSKYALPEIMWIPFAKKSAFIMTIDMDSGWRCYNWTEERCTDPLDPQNDTAFWYTMPDMVQKAEECKVVMTPLMCTEYFNDTIRPGYYESLYHPDNIARLQDAYNNPWMEIGYHTYAHLAWTVDYTDEEYNYMGAKQAIQDLRNALNLTNFIPKTYRNPGHWRRSMWGVGKAGIRLDVSGYYPQTGRIYITFPYENEAGFWYLQDRGAWHATIDYSQWSEKREETHLDWYIDFDYTYECMTHDQEFCPLPTHNHGGYVAHWNYTPIFLKYASSRSDVVWIVGGNTFADYLDSLNATSVSTTWDATTSVYTFTVTNPPNGLAFKIPLNGSHVSGLTGCPLSILKEHNGYAYLSILSPDSSETIKVYLGSEVYVDTPYITSCNATIERATMATAKAKINLTAPAGIVSHTTIFCGDYGRPTKVLIDNVRIPINYNDSTKILTIEITHSSSSEVVVDWNPLGDVNSDGVVDASDLFDLSKAYGSKPGDVNWNPDCDINDDSIVSVMDLAIVGENYGNTFNPSKRIRRSN